uniref:Uncharacterized protein n=1 Tax=Alexandrium catenella TaxID=2925 RepID=A0A7S1LT44_ALECA|mmetsp:Transcript_13012/g.35711  ORF Transcript_13012/g.35711 Transcript_13012/m.35711 type:complete len:256 (+) Transcript_13012:51-818(+)
MGAQVSEELTTWASISDLALIVPRMKVIPALTPECQVKVIRRLWRNLRWLPAGEPLVMTRRSVAHFIVLVAGEAEAMLGTHPHIWLMPPGTFFCEAVLLDWRGLERSGLRSFMSPAWALRDWRRIPAPARSIVKDFLKLPLNGPRFQGNIRTTRRSLVATLTRQELLDVVDEVPGARAAVHKLDDVRVACDALRNVTTFSAPSRDLGAKDIAALKVVCEGPVFAACRGAVMPDLRSQVRDMFGCCTSSSHVPDAL